MICEKCHWGGNKSGICTFPSNAHVVDGKCESFMMAKQSLSTIGTGFYAQYEKLIGADQTKELDKMICWCADHLSEQGNNRHYIQKVLADLFFAGDKSMAEPFVEYVK